MISLSLPRRLGDLMVESGVLPQEQLDKALEQQRQHGGKLGSILLELGCIEEPQLLEFLGKQCGINYVKLSELESIEDEVISKVPEHIARQHVLIPIALGQENKKDTLLRIAVADPLNVLILDDLKMMTGLEIEAVLASKTDILAAIERFYHQETADEVLDDILKASGADERDKDGLDVVSDQEEDSAGGSDIIDLKSGEDTPVIQMVNLIIGAAIKAKASDIHLEPFAKEVQVRYRIDGVLHLQPAPPKRFQNALISRIKIMANLDIAEKRVPQDGRIKLKIRGTEFAMRVSVLPCSFGEKICMRILDSSNLNVNMNDLGFEPEALAIFNKCIKAPYGINLITGPTGSGKSTTLYSALSVLNEPGVNISTAEDPVEFQLHGINQVGIRADIGLTFPAALRSFLRQDPDIIMVGEIRDLETIQIAINAALTGHLVFSTLHTNDAPGAITRMGMMGIEPFLMSSALLMVVAQRLVRGVCKDCREAYEVDADWLSKLGLTKSAMPISNGKVALSRGKGCDVCAGTGYKGRLGLYEVLEITDALRALIMDRAPVSRIKEQARKQGMLNLRGCVIRKLLAGQTTVEEMIRVTASE